MDNSLKIVNVEKIYDGNMNVGRIDNSRKRREYDGFVYFVYGKTEYVFSDGVEFTAYKDTVIFLPKDSSYRMHITEPSQYIVVNFEFEKCDSVRGAELFCGFSPKMKNSFEKLFYIWHGQGDSILAEVFSALYGIYAGLISSRERKYLKSASVTDSAVRYIMENYTDPELNIADIAKSLCVSQAHMRRLFKASFGTSPMKYANYLRLEKAKHLLEESNYAVCAAAELSGFSDPFYFSREFKKHIGVSPSEYKKIKG